jgi:hypothetical protein
MRRFTSHIAQPAGTECWIWTGSKTRSGYGRIKINGETKRAHRVSYELHVGPIPPQAMVLHSCDTPSCVNPGHLRVGDNQANVNDRQAREREARGVKVPNAKLTDEQAAKIRIAPGTYREIAEQYSVSASTVWRVKRRIWWKHV